MPEELPRHLLEALVQAREIGELSAGELVELFRQEPGITSYLPDGAYATDPRTGDHILFNAARASRPHDNRPPDVNNSLGASTCIICQGQTTGIIDVAELTEGYTFINKNLFPVLYPFAEEWAARSLWASADDDQPDGTTVRGLHFLQWTSSLHDRDWHNMPFGDRLIVFERLAALERKLLLEANELLAPFRTPPSAQQAAASVLITKNYGHLVGGSLVHGHQQIALSSVQPRRFADNLRFQQLRGETFADHMLRQNPQALIVQDYGPAVLMVPYFMRRPYDMMLLLKNTSRQFLHQLAHSELGAVAAGWRDAIRAMRAIMPAIGRETAYNVLTNNGPGAGLYFEFRPYTQEFGGFEQLGLLICQASPAEAARRIRQVLAEP